MVSRGRLHVVSARIVAEARWGQHRAIAFGISGAAMGAAMCMELSIWFERNFSGHDACSGKNCGIRDTVEPLAT
jgi:hypothetical protein